MICADDYRGIGGFLAHLPTPSYVEKNYSQVSSPQQQQRVPEKYKHRNLAIENLHGNYIWISDLDIFIKVRVASEDIMPGEILGFDYEERYWFNARFTKAPCLFTKLREFVPKDIYQHDFGVVVKYSNFKDLGYFLFYNYSPDSLSSFLRRFDAGCRQDKYFLMTEKGYGMPMLFLLSSTEAKRVHESFQQKQDGVIIQSYYTASEAQIEKCLGLILDFLQKHLEIERKLKLDFTTNRKTLLR